MEFNQARSMMHGESNRGSIQAYIKGIDKKNRRVTAVVSTVNVDRYDEVIEPEAFRKWLPAFLKNPVLVAGHIYQSEDGSPTVIGKWISLEITKEGMIGTCEFMPAGDRLADEWWARFEGGYVRAFSVGLIAHGITYKQLKEGEKTVSRKVITEAELIEISAVSIPANRQSLVIAAGVPGLDDEADAGGEGAGESGGMSNRKLNKLVARQIKPTLREALADALEAEPGTPLCQFVQTVAEVTIDSLAARGFLKSDASCRHADPYANDPYGGFNDDGSPVDGEGEESATGGRTSGKHCRPANGGPAGKGADSLLAELEELNAPKSPETRIEAVLKQFDLKTLRYRRLRRSSSAG